MTRLLYIQSSPRAESASTAVAQEFLTTYREASSENEIDTLNLWEENLPAFDGNTLTAKYRVLHGQEHNSAEAQAWLDVVKVTERFKAADQYLFSIPMWNFGIPYVLKHFIDIIVQPGLTFQFSPTAGYTGLVTGRTAVAIYARGGAYQGAAEAVDLQTKYMNLILGFIGITDVRPILVEPTLGDPATVQNGRSASIEQARKLALELGTLRSREV